MDLLDLLLSAHGNDKTSQLTDEELIEEALTFGKFQYRNDFLKVIFSNLVLAGHETTATLMTWTLYNLANNPDVCRRLEAEIDSVLNENEEITPSTLSLLNLYRTCFKRIFTTSSTSSSISSNSNRRQYFN